MFWTVFTSLPTLIARSKQKGRLKKLLTMNLKTVRAYLIAFDLQNLWTYKSATWAEKFPSQWCTIIIRSQII